MLIIAAVAVPWSVYLCMLSTPVCPAKMLNESICSVEGRVVWIQGTMCYMEVHTDGT